MSKEKRRVPKLRFPGFTEDWEQRKLSEVVTINPKTELPDEFKYVDLESVVGTNLLGFKVIKKEESRKEVEIDVGVGSLMTLSNGEKYDNPRFKNGKNNDVKKHRVALYKKLSREYGFANEKFRNDYKEIKNKENIFLKPSKKYLETQNKISKLERKVARKRKHHMENMVLDIVRKYDYIAIETLSVKSMYA